VSIGSGGCVLVPFRIYDDADAADAKRCDQQIRCMGSRSATVAAQTLPLQNIKLQNWMRMCRYLQAVSRQLRLTSVQSGRYGQRPVAIR